MPEIEKHMTLIEWLTERKENAERISTTKTGADRDGWLEDQKYFQEAIVTLHRSDGVAGALFDLQWTRMGEATKLWREATGQHDVWPDLGDLLKWLMDRFIDESKENDRLEKLLTSHRERKAKMKSLEGLSLDEFAMREVELEQKLVKHQEWIQAARQFTWAHEQSCPRHDADALCNCGLDAFLAKEMTLAKRQRAVGRRNAYLEKTERSW